MVLAVDTHQNRVPGHGGARAPVERLLLDLFERYKSLAEGLVAQYIPELAKADPGWFGISIVTLDGHDYSVGDTDEPFTIQSISKPFVYGLALENRGEDYVREKVGLEPSGDAFNAISLHPATGIPSNPMINAGAIATSGVAGSNDREPLRALLDMFGRYVGHEVAVDEAVLQSESETGHRNRAIGYMLRNFGIVEGDPEEVLALYFRQCSVSVTCKDLAMMAATLANAGVNPVTGVQAVEPRYVPNVLSVMASCGMYDYAGEWIYRVGMPAKSGVSGGVLAVLPGQMGIGVFSPRLDERGNSVRGVRVFADLTRAFSLHMLNVPNLAYSAIRNSHDVASVRSKRQRSGRALEVLGDRGARARVYELQGDLVFASVEAFTREVAEAWDSFDVICIDFKHASGLGDGETVIVTDLIGVILGEGKSVALSNASHLPWLLAAVSQATEPGADLAIFPGKDLAMEWCEDRLLAEDVIALDAAIVPLADNELCEGLDADALVRLENSCQEVQFASGDTILQAGEASASVYFLLSGDVSVMIEVPGAEPARLATLSAGMAFGEMALLGESSRSASVIADSDVTCLELEVASLEVLDAADPTARATVYRNLARKVAGNLKRANAEIQALSA